MPQIDFPYRGKQGAIVVAVTEPGSPGEKAGFRVGDVIFHSDGQPVPVENSIAALRERVIPLSFRAT